MLILTKNNKKKKYFSNDIQLCNLQNGDKYRKVHVNIYKLRKIVSIISQIQ